MFPASRLPAGLEWKWPPGKAPVSTDEDVWKKIDSAARAALNQERAQFERETETGLEDILRQSWHDTTQRTVFALNAVGFCSRRIEDWGRLVRVLYLRPVDEQRFEETPDLLKAVFRHGVIPEIQAQSRQILLLLRRLARREGVPSTILSAETDYFHDLTSASIRDYKAELQRELRDITGRGKKLRSRGRLLKTERSPRRTFDKDRSKTRAWTVAKLIKEHRLKQKLLPEKPPQPAGYGRGDENKPIAERLKFRKLTGGGIAVDESFSPVALLNTRNKLVQIFKDVRNVVRTAARKGKAISARDLTKRFTRTPLARVANLARWNEWKDGFASGRLTAKNAALVLLEEATDRERTTLESVQG